MDDRLVRIANRITNEAIEEFICTIQASVVGQYIHKMPLPAWLYQRFRWASNQISTKVYKILIEEMRKSRKQNHEDYVRMG